MVAPLTRSFVKPCPAVPRRHALDSITMNAVHAGAGRPIVFIHGIGWDHSLWGGAIAHFSDRYLTIAGDICGHGATDKPEGPYSVDGFAQQWAELIRKLAGEKALVVGFSLGGMIAQTLAVDHPDVVGALILANTSCRSPSVGKAHMQERLAAMQDDNGPAAAARLAAQSVFSASWRDANPDKIADFVDWRVAQDQRGLGEAMKAASRFDLADRVSAIDVPTLVVTALGDKLMLPSDQAIMRSLIPGAEYVEIDNSGHMLPIEQADLFEAAIDVFLARYWSASETHNSTTREDVPTKGSKEESL